MIVKVKSKNHILIITPMALSFDQYNINLFSSVDKHNVWRQKCLLRKWSVSLSSKCENSWLDEYKLTQIVLDSPNPAKIDFFVHGTFSGAAVKKHPVSSYPRDALLAIGTPMVQPTHAFACWPQLPLWPSIKYQDRQKASNTRSTQTKELHSDPFLISSFRKF